LKNKDDDVWNRGEGEIADENKLWKMERSEGVGADINRGSVLIESSALLKIFDSTYWKRRKAMSMTEENKMNGPNRQPSNHCAWKASTTKYTGTKDNHNLQ
jgi:hypothetical protein